MNKVKGSSVEHLLGRLFEVASSLVGGTVGVAGSADALVVPLAVLMLVVL